MSTVIDNPAGRSPQARTPARNARVPLLYSVSWVDTVAAWLLAILWILPLLYAFWTAFHPAEFSTRFDITAPWTLDNFRHA